MGRFIKTLMSYSMPAALAQYVSDNFYIASVQADLDEAVTLGKNIIIGSAITLTANTTITSSLTINKGGSVTTNGFTLTINGPFNAGAYKVFTTSGSQVVFGPNSTQAVLMEWFGALGDGTTDDTAAIQLAFNIGTTARIPITPLYKTYKITSISVPNKCTVISPMGRTSGATFQAIDASTMFVCPTAYSESQITFRGGINIDGNNDSALAFDVAGATGLVLDGIGFQYVTIAIKMTGNSGGLAWIHRCRFAGDITTIAQIGAGALNIHFDECMFASTSTTGIYTDSTWTGDNLNIVGCTFDLPSNTYGVRCERASNTPTMHVRIANNRFDGASSNSNIYIGQYVYANIEGNGISGNSGAAMSINGDECYIANNFLGNVGITFGANSRYCIAGPQKWGGFSPHYVDNGTLNLIDSYDSSPRYMGTTAQRPTLMATGMFGRPYLDTTLDADGKPIWWNGTAWVDATGATV